MGRELQPTFDVTREIPTTGHAASRPRPTFPKLRVRPDGTLVISPLVNFSRDAHLESDPAAGGDEQHPPCATSPLNPEDSPTGGGGGHFREPWSVKLFLLALSYWLAGWIALATLGVIVARMVGA